MSPFIQKFPLLSSYIFITSVGYGFINAYTSYRKYKTLGPLIPLIMGGIEGIRRLGCGEIPCSYVSHSKIATVVIKDIKIEK